MTSSKGWLGIKEGNKLLRKHLAAEFPGVKFSVKGQSYSGGSSTDISWIDGPLQKQVEKIASAYGYKGFDGMIDLQYSYSQYLTPEGRIVCGGTSGTVGSMGTVSPFKIEPPAGSVPICSGIGYVFCNRKHSVGMYRRAVESVCRKYGVEPVPEVIDDGFEPHLAREAQNLRVGGAGWQGEYLSNLVHRDLVRRTNYLRPCRKEAA
jgi:Large polyvalent protein associated domain 29